MESPNESLVLSRTRVTPTITSARSRSPPQESATDNTDFELIGTVVAGVAAVAAAAFIGFKVFSSRDNN